MNQIRIEGYMNELENMLETHQQQAKQESAAKAQLEMLTDAGEQEKAMKIANQREAIKAVVASIELTIARRTRCNDVESARKLYTDIAVRLQSADKLFEEWRRIESRYELAVTTGQLVDEKRAEAGAALTQARELYETQISLASQLVPNVVELLHATSGLLAGV